MEITFTVATPLPSSVTLIAVPVKFILVVAATTVVPFLDVIRLELTIPDRSIVVFKILEPLFL